MSLPHAVIVLDGVSTLSGSTPLGGWYSDCLGLQLAIELTAAPDRDLREVLDRAIAAVTRRRDLVPGESPAATVAMVRLHAGQVDALVLADTPVVALLHDGSVDEVRDDRLADLVTPQHRYQEYQDRLRAGEGFGSADHRRLLQELRGIQMEHVNREVPGAYWVAEAVPEAARHAVVRSWPAADISGLLVMTDGVSCAVEEYGLYPSWAALAQDCAARGPQSVVDTVHSHEETDSDGRRYPRYKPHDDKALVWAEIVGGAR
ncbi:protein phosphatase 2C domain-containing protein [Streptomyces sp. NPDC006367]|uniref:protein phosphatase 2C domain-containing protein n=1 Tax=unclassified Streptomyces TaxID=2593676 RepID=UPI0033B6F28A